VQSAAKGQYVIGSFQGTQGKEQIDKDYALAARLVYETGAPLLEANLSCPNEGASRLLCFDIALVERIVNQIKNTVPNRPLLLKLAYFNDDDNLIKLLRRIGKLVDGFSAINTISARPINHQHQPALGKKRVESGICGEAIRWAGLDMVKRLAQLRQEMDLTYAIVGVGGVSEPEHYQQYRQAGADAVMSATGAMWHPDLAMLIKQSIK
ncbi:MAG: tRNA-dihydrouridine synthase, partial [Candidatus Schmidhempelia sp.]|nr:tRNA-dihydrouridine synthase [Candidatus Schmidhempelia sp.]